MQLLFLAPLCLQERFAAAITPAAAAALSTFAAGSTPLHTQPDSFLGSLALNRLLTAAALVDAGTANKICDRFNQAAAAAGVTAGTAADAQLLLSPIHPDLQHAVLDVAAAQPPGCQLDWSGTVGLH